MQHQQSSLGEILENARRVSGLSYKQLSIIAGIQRTTIQRLCADDVAAPRPEHLAALATHLELSTTDLFKAAGIEMPQTVPSLAALLRAEYDLTDGEVREAQASIARIIHKHQQQRMRISSNQQRTSKGETYDKKQRDQ